MDDATFGIDKEREKLGVVMKFTMAHAPSAASAIWLALIFLLYLAPSKYFTADLLAALLLFVALAVFGLRRSGIMGGVKPLAPLLALSLYVVALSLFKGTGSDAMPYVKELWIGFLPFLLLYVMFRNLAPAHVPMLAGAVFVVPGLVHLGLMYLDIFLVIKEGDVPFLSSSKHGLLEYIKDAPRVGRRYLSLALLHLLCGLALVAWHIRSVQVRYVVLGLAGVVVLSLALLDARAAYVSVVIGGAMLVSAVGARRAWQTLKSLLPVGLGGKAALIGLLIVAAGLGYNAGKSRWVAMNYSFSAAVHDVFYSKTDLAQRAFVSQSYWDAPIEDIDTCYLEGHFRCKIDQSAYLRLAWLLSGLKSLVEHPFGIGYSNDYMARLWGVDGQHGKYQRTDSFLVEHVVSFGVLGITLYALLVWGVLRSVRRALQLGATSTVLMVVCGIFFVCVGRGLVDVLTEGFWRYLMALLGMYYGLLHSNGRRANK